MRAIMNIFKHKKRNLRNRRKKGPLSSPRKNDVHTEFSLQKENENKPGEQLKKVSHKFDLLEELQR